MLQSPEMEELTFQYASHCGQSMRFREPDQKKDSQFIVGTSTVIYRHQKIFMDYALWLNNHLLRKASAFEPLIS
jgi:hypothetical protein